MILIGGNSIAATSISANEGLRNRSYYRKDRAVLRFQTSLPFVGNSRTHDIISTGGAANITQRINLDFDRFRSGGLIAPLVNSIRYMEFAITQSNNLGADNIDLGKIRINVLFLDSSRDDLNVRSFELSIKSWMDNLNDSIALDTGVINLNTPIGDSLLDDSNILRADSIKLTGFCRDFGDVCRLYSVNFGIYDVFI